MAKENNLFSKSRFTFVGTITYSKKDDAPISVKPLKEVSPWSRKRLSIGVQDEAKNVGYLNCEYMFKPSDPKVKLFDKDGKGYDVDIKDLGLQKNIDLVPDFNRIIIDLEEDFELKKEYTKDIYALRELLDKEEQTDEVKAKIEEHKKNIEEKAKNRYECGHMDTFIETLNAHLKELDGKKVRVTGVVNINYYNGKSRLEYVPSRIDIARPDEKSELVIDSKIFFADDCMDYDEENRKIFINAFMGQKYKKKNKLFPVQLVIDYSKIDLNNSLHAQMLSILENSFKAEDDETMFNNRILIRVINGREEVEFDESCLTEQQLAMVMCGLATVESFRPRGSVYGNKIQELKVIRPMMTEEYKNGAIVAFDLENLATYLVNENDDESDIKQEDVKTEEPKSEELDFSNLFS